MNIKLLFIALLQLFIITDNLTTMGVLKDFYRETNGDHWTYNKIDSKHWFTNTDFCSWYGIWCKDGTNFIKNITLDSSNLTGFISPSLKYLKHLIGLDLSNNNLTSTVPFINLPPNIRTLKLNNNKFYGEISHNITKLPLEYLNLSYNNLIGPLRLPKTIIEVNADSSGLDLGLEMYPQMVLLSAKGNYIKN